MKRLRFLILTLVVVDCSHPQPLQLSGKAIRIVPFSASNTARYWTIRGSLRGHVDLYENAINVVAYADTIVDVRSEADQAQPARLCAALASGDPDGHWRLERRSNIVPLSLLSRGDSADFIIPDVSRRALTNEWLVFEFRWWTFDPQDHRRVEATAYLHVPAARLNVSALSTHSG